MIDVKISGMALNSLGFVAYNTVEGLGLNTFGFLWPCSGIWAPTELAITTTWDNPSSDPVTLITTWLNCMPGVSLGPEYCID